MDEVDQKKPKVDPIKPQYIEIYHKIKSRCWFQKIFSGFLLGVFFLLQYSVPIFLVVLGSIASSKDQLITLFPSSEVKTESTSEVKTESTSEVIVSRIIYLVGLVTILLGVVNNIVRPAESYDTSARYNNRFHKFEQKLDLEFLAISSFPDEINNNKDTVKIIIDFLLKSNDELAQLIEEYNDARSLSSRATHLQALNQEKKECDLETDDNLSVVKTYEKVASSNSSTSLSTKTESDETMNNSS